MAWVKLSAVDFNADQLQAVVDSIVAIIDAFTAVLDLFVATLNILSAFLLLATNLIDAIVNAVIATIEQTILDLLQNNIGAALHVNMNWNSAWKYKRRPNDDPNKVQDFVNDDILPWVGTGMGGWLLELNASTTDPTDPMRPLTDAETKVNGTIFVKGIPANGDIQELKAIFDAFTQWGDLEDAFDFTDELSELSEARQILDRFGPAMASSFMADTVGGAAVIGAEFLGLFDSDLSEFLPTPGSYPKWMSVPLALLLPPVGELMELLRAVANALRADLSAFDNLQKIIAFLEKRAQLLAEAADRLAGLVETIAGIILFFLETYMFTATVDSGGFSAFINEALGADGLPDFGSRGIVVGICMITTQDDPSNHFENLMSLIGLQLQDFSTTVTDRSADLADAWDPYFP